MDYILKPVSETRVKKTIERLLRQLEHSPAPGAADEKLQRIIQILENRSAPEYLQLIRVKTGNEIVFVPVFETLFFKADEKYTTVQTTKKSFLINTPIKDLEARLDPRRFWRVHRNAIINVERIEKITRSFTNQMLVNFNGSEETVPVSRAYEHLFKT